MHPNPAFRKTSRETNVTFARERGFGVLAVNAPGGPLISHIPFLLEGDGGLLLAHLVRSNPILGLLDEPAEAVLAVSGGDAYVSPDWYGMADQVPTWNYVAVHLRGRLRRLDDKDLHLILDRLSAHFEARLAPKTPWTSGKMDQEAYQRMLRQIVPIALDVADIQGTWKLNQNKPDAARLGAAGHIRDDGPGLGAAKVAELMKKAGKA